MKKIFYFLFVLPFLALAQSTDQNYIKTTFYKQANTTSVSNPAPSVATVQITYFDGLGRPIQGIANQQSPLGKDIIKPIVYNAFGVMSKNYLPYASSGSTMTYDTAAITNVTNYPLYNGETPYSEKQYEASPLNRLLKEGSAGNDWDLPISGSDPDHTTKIDYINNTTADQVKLFKAIATWSAANGLYNITMVNSSGTTYYGANELYKTVIKNENWTAGNNDTTQEFKDKDGNVVLKRNFDNGSAHDTYYVYDQFGNLIYMIPPLATNIATQLDGLCYQYKYDYRNRLVEKKLPGKQWEFIVYDKLNRVVATGPSFSPFNDLIAPNNVGWIIAKYDAFNRTIYTGWAQSTTVTSAGRKILQDAQNNLTTTLNENKLTTGTIDGIPAYYSNLVAPTSFKLLMVNYYDNYTFPNVPVIPTSVESQTTLTTTQVKGLATGNWTRVLTKSTNILGDTNTIFYDAKGRVIRAYKKNHLGGYTQVDSNLDFAGVPQYMITYHKRLTSDTELKTTDTFVYSPQGRLSTHTHQIGTGVVELLSKNDYNEIGQLITKRVGATDITGAACLQKIDYTYNIRGWLTGINDIANLTIGTAPQDLFAFKINYNTVQNETGYTGTALYNGNISETYWRTKSDNVLRKYGYKYDNLHRLKNAIYQKPEATVVVQNSYNENLKYDKNGNIIALQRNGNGDGISPAIEIDNLEYVYDTNSNNLLKVADAPTTNTSGFKDGSNTDDDYKYDGNGNLILDQNKGITAIIYNHINLPTKITFGATGNIVYIYNALGSKVQKVVTQGATVTTTDYLTGYQYKNNVLQFFPTSEGYVAKNGALYSYVYQYKDHLGNARLSYTKNTTTGVLDIIEESHFYPFGLKHSGYNNGGILTNSNADAQKYKFQEQERQEEMGLNLDNFKYRNYDYAIGRFLNVDPLSEKYNWQSNYSFCSNQVIHSRELEGLEAENDYNDGDDHDWNAGLVGIDENNHGVGFGGVMTTDPNDMFPKEGELHEILVTNRIEKGTQERPDNDSDGYDRIADIALDFTPVLGGLKDIYQGYQNGNYWQMGLGALIVTIDVATLGTDELLIGAGKTIGKELLEHSAEALVAKGLGSTGRTEAKSLAEQLAMKEIMSNPHLGESVIKGMNDSRWLGWDKMQYIHEGLDGVNINIHYVGEFENGILKSVDDFKFKF
ncbi:MAG: DUF6443 domain-containing protein [Flavobacterium sp.]|uniref:DUF6443 domain-containing protein n=1 Tax=Flavobacterium sp. TaxID=239 RepID=UPI003267224E